MQTHGPMLWWKNNWWRWRDYRRESFEFGFKINAANTTRKPMHWKFRWSKRRFVEQFCCPMWTWLTWLVSFILRKWNKSATDECMEYRLSLKVPSETMNRRLTYMDLKWHRFSHLGRWFLISRCTPTRKIMESIHQHIKTLWIRYEAKTIHIFFQFTYC